MENKEVMADMNQAKKYENLHGGKTDELGLPHEVWKAMNKQQRLIYSAARRMKRQGIRHTEENANVKHAIEDDDLLGQTTGSRNGDYAGDCDPHEDESNKTPKPGANDLTRGACTTNRKRLHAVKQIKKCDQEDGFKTQTRRFSK